MTSSSPGPRIRQRSRPPATPAQPPFDHGSNPPASSAEQSGPPDYEVGYGRPPQHSRFRPGRSGNPRGRPRGAKGIQTIVREAMTAKVEVRTPTGTRRISKMEAMILKIAELGMKGNVRALTQLISYYNSAVPDEPINLAHTTDETLTATDQAILDAFSASIRAAEGNAK